MANPVTVSCSLNAWTKVATNVQIGNVWILSTNPTEYLHTYRLTAQAAPTDKSEGALFTRNGIGINSSVGIDVYIYPTVTAGLVRVDV